MQAPSLKSQAYKLRKKNLEYALTVTMDAPARYIIDLDIVAPPCPTLAPVESRLQRPRKNNIIGGL